MTRQSVLKRFFPWNWIWADTHHIARLNYRLDLMTSESYTVELRDGK
jgi:hypothetical protein